MSNEIISYFVCLLMADYFGGFMKSLPKYLSMILAAYYFAAAVMIAWPT